MCGREPNFELAEEEKQELRGFKWDEFLAVTRKAINNKSNHYFPCLSVFIIKLLALNMCSIKGLHYYT